MTTNSSPEFEFSTTSINDEAQNHLLSADQLFSHGQILPLDHHTIITTITHHSPPNPNPNPNPSPIPKPKKWKKLFTSHNAAKSNANVNNGSTSQYSHSTISQHELNIHIWPFSRSRSSGNGNGNGGSTALGRSRSIRKSASAPCSRNNSQGHDVAASNKSIGKKWGSLTGGIHVGRSMPVFQLKRKKANAAAAAAAAANVNIDDSTHHLQVNSSSCSSGVLVDGEGDRNAVVSGGDRASLFNLRSIFSKKVVY